MVEEQMFTNANKKLLVLWSLLRQHALWEKSPNYKSDYMYFNVSVFIEKDLISFGQIIGIIKRLLVVGVIEKLHITKEEPQDDGYVDTIANFYFTSEEVAMRDKEDSPFSILPVYNVDHYFFWTFYIELNQKKCKGCIKNYLAYWKNNKFKHERKNLLQSRKQVGRLVYNIRKLLEDYPSVNLLLKYNSSTYEETDFFATLFFLESVHDIEIVEFLFIDGQIAFRINVKDKFHRDFPSDDEIFVDLNEIADDSSPEAMVDRIALKAPKLLVYKDFKYEIKENKVPYHLIHLAKRKKGTVDQLELRNVTGETPEQIKKALENFRKGLRKNFKFPSSELFFELKGGLIQFKTELFDFA